MGIGQQALSSLTGNIETALLVIHDYRQQAKKDTAEWAKEGRVLSTEDETHWLDSTRSWQTKKALDGNKPITYPGSQDRILKVQFNPSELMLNASAVPQDKQDATTNQSRTMAVEDASLMLSVKLYFDDMDTYDAFMWDKITLGLSAQTAANVVKMGQDVFTENGSAGHSVQTQVEALVAALRNPYTRTISFRWTDFVFTGMLNSVQANYTMFSPSGRPIRAEVGLRIQHEMDPHMLHVWYENFKKAFGNDTSNLVKPEQGVGNLLNLPL